ncbi:MAG: hypothetical protein U1E45_23065 [Geminicoccaceae bacterium]
MPARRVTAARAALLRTLAVMLAGVVLALRPASAEPLFGFTAFPYDLSTEAEDRVHAIIDERADIFAIHMDQCLPWAEMLADAPFPAWLEASWQEVKRRLPQGRIVYLATTPTGMDRETLAIACGASEDAPVPLPDAIADRPLDDPLVMEAYGRYVQRNIDLFRPRYVNIGIEMSEMALRRPERWPAFERLYLATLQRLRQRNPGVGIGIEMVLQSLLEPRVAALVRPAVEAGDFLCLSFYPYGGDAGVFWGAPPLAPPPEQWRGPLQWVRGYSSKPLAVCETGYTTREVTLADSGLRFPGDEALQAAFLGDLVRTAREDGYLFVIWFITVDYERLLDKLPGAAEWMRIWAYTGLYASDLTPKPALGAWPRPHAD